MNRLTRLCILAAAGVLALAGPVLAAPSFFGYTGLVVVPTGEALDKDDYNVAVFALGLDEGPDLNVYAANVGVDEALEVGFTRLDPERGSGETFINAKYRVMSETTDHPCLAVGVVDFTDEVDSTVYVVASKSLFEKYRMSFDEVVSARLDVGIGGGQFDGLFAGLSAAVGERVRVSAEYDSDDVNFGAGLALNEDFRAHIAGLNGFDDIGLGISYSRDL